MVGLESDVFSLRIIVDCTSLNTLPQQRSLALYVNTQSNEVSDDSWAGKGIESVSKA
jgi:hypothetical protein